MYLNYHSLKNITAEHTYVPTIHRYILNLSIYFYKTRTAISRVNFGLFLRYFLRGVFILYPMYISSLSILINVFVIRLMLLINALCTRYLAKVGISWFELLSVRRKKHSEHGRRCQSNPSWLMYFFSVMTTTFRSMIPPFALGEMFIMLVCRWQWVSPFEKKTQKQMLCWERRSCIETYSSSTTGLTQ